MSDQHPHLSPVEEIPEAECWQLLERASIGRIAAFQLHSDAHDDGIDIFPINYIVRDGAVYFRSGPGSKLMEIAKHEAIAFEVDGHHGSTHWSVIIHGKAERLAIDTEIEDSGVIALESFHPSEKWSYVRITPAAITGRRFQHHYHVKSAPASSTETPGAQQPPAHTYDL